MPDLRHQISSAYIQAMNRLSGKNAPRKIVAYVESYDDVSFWSTVLRPLERDGIVFEILLPSSTSLGKGKKVALANELGNRLGNCLIACVDADYDYLLQGTTATSETVCRNPYVFHTYAYAIESLQCYAPTLHNVCVTATLTDKRIFDFEAFFEAYSLTIWPLFVWNVWCYRYGFYTRFSMADFLRIVAPREISLTHPETTIEDIRRRCNKKVAQLQRDYPQGKRTLGPLRDQILSLGIRPEETYLYMRGHDLFDAIVSPLVQKVCDALRRSQERDIRSLAHHRTQLQNELSSYEHSISPPDQVLRRHTGFVTSPVFRRILDDVNALIDKMC